MKEQIHRLLLSACIAAVALVVAFSFGQKVKAYTTGDEQEPNDSFAQANPIEEGTIYSGTIDKNNDDYYKFVLSSPGIVYVYKSDNADYNASINPEFYDSNNNLVIGDLSTFFTGGPIAVKLTAGTYYMMFHCNARYGGGDLYDYSFRYELEPSKVPFTKINANNTKEGAEEVTIGPSYYGQIALNDQEDYYKLTLDSDGELTIDFDSKINVCFLLKDVNNQQIDDDYKRISIGEKSLSYDLKAGTYYLYFMYGAYYFYDTSESNGSYSFKLSFDGPGASPTPVPTAVPTGNPTTSPSGNPTKAPANPTKAPAGSLAIDKTTDTVVCGKTTVLKATGKNASKATWKSSDTKIATVDKNGTVTGKMAGTVTITATASGQSAICTVTVLYKDVTNSKDFWYAPTNYLTAKGVVKGYDKQTKFKPANECTRAQMVTFIWRLAGEPSPKAKTCKFKDVKKSDYFYKACIWGNEKHIVEGYKDGTFGPQIICARRHAVTFLWRLAGQPKPSSSKNKFSDVKKSDYFYTATLWASEMKILAGYSDGTFRPNGNCLRRQMVTFLYKYDKFVNEKT